MPSEDQSRPSTGCTNRPALTNSNVVSSPPTTFVRLPWILLPRPDLLKHPSRSGPHPLHRNLHLMVSPVSGDPSAITTFQRRLPTFSQHPWRKGPKKQYSPNVKKWMAFCCERKINYYSPPLSDALQFLLGYLMINQGRSYSTLN